MNKFRIWLFVLALVVGAAGASGYANWWFYRSLAEGFTEGLVYAVMGASADVWKFIGLSATAVLVLERRHFWAWFGRAIWAGCVVASIIAAIGFSSSVQAGLEDPRSAALERRDLLQTEIAADQAELDALQTRGEPKSPGEVEGELTALLNGPPVYEDGTLGTGTLRSQLEARTGAYCDGAFDGPLTRQYCPQIGALQAEVTRAERYVALTANLRANRAELRGIEAPASGDAEAAAFSTLATLGGTSSGWKSGTIIFFAILIEILACTGESFMRLLSPKWRLGVPRVDLALIGWIASMRRAWAGLPQPAPAAVVRNVPEPAAPPASKPKPAPEPQPAPAVTFTPPAAIEPEPAPAVEAQPAPEPAHGEFTPDPERPRPDPKPPAPKKPTGPNVAEFRPTIDRRTRRA